MLGIKIFKKNILSMPVFKNKGIKFYLIGILFLAGLAVLLFNDFGVIKYLKLKSETDALKNQVKKIEKENQLLESEIDSLEKKVPAKIERTAREDHDMSREGEKTINIIEK